MNLQKLFHSCLFTSTLFCGCATSKTSSIICAPPLHGLAMVMWCNIPARPSALSRSFPTTSLCGSSLSVCVLSFFSSFFFFLLLLFAANKLPIPPTKVRIHHPFLPGNLRKLLTDIPSQTIAAATNRTHFPHDTHQSFDPTQRLSFIFASCTQTCPSLPKLLTLLSSSFLFTHTSCLHDTSSISLHNSFHGGFVSVCVRFPFCIPTCLHISLLELTCLSNIHSIDHSFFDHGSVSAHILWLDAPVRSTWHSVASHAPPACRAECVVHVVLAVLHDLQDVYSGSSLSLRLRRQPRATKGIADARGSLHGDARPLGSFFPTLGTCELLRSSTAQPPPVSPVMWSG